MNKDGESDGEVFKGKINNELDTLCETDTKYHDDEKESSKSVKDIENNKYTEELYDVDPANSENICMIWDTLKKERLYVIEETDELNQPITVKRLEVEDRDISDGSYKVVEEVYNYEKSNDDASESNVDTVNVLKKDNDSFVTVNNDLKDDVDDIFDEEQEKRDKYRIKHVTGVIESRLEQTDNNCKPELIDDNHRKENSVNDKRQGLYKVDKNTLVGAKSKVLKIPLQNLRLYQDIKLNCVENVKRTISSDKISVATNKTKPNPNVGNQDEKEPLRVVVLNSDYEQFFKNTVQNINFPDTSLKKTEEDIIKIKKKSQVSVNLHDENKIAKIEDDNTNAHEQEKVEQTLKGNHNITDASGRHNLIKRKVCLQYKIENGNTFRQIKRSKYEACNNANGLNIQHKSDTNERLHNLDDAIQCIKRILSKLSQNQKVESSDETIKDAGDIKTIVGEDNCIIEDTKIKDEIDDGHNSKLDIGNISKLLYDDDESYNSSDEKCFLKHKKLHSRTIRKCKKCNYSTNRPKDLVKHMQVHSEADGNKILKCSHCHFKTLKTNTLKQHLIMHECSEDTELFQYNKCLYQSEQKPNVKGSVPVLYTTPIKDALKTQLTAHEKVEALQLYKCEQCTFTTKRKESLLVHALAHKDETRTYDCVECPYRAKRKAHLKTHLLKHTKQDEVVEHHCRMCT